MTPAPVLGLAVALAADALLGDPPNRLHPVVAMGGLIRRLSLPAAQSPAWLLVRGVLLLCAGALLFAAPWLVLAPLGRRLPWWLEGLLLGMALKPMFALRRLLEAGREVRRALERHDLPEARRLVSWHLVSRDTAALSEAQVCSAAVESLAENLTDSFLAPLLCYAVGGLPLAWLYRYVNTADSMIGYRTERYEYLGKAAARLDDVLNWLPARLAAVTLALAAGFHGMEAGSAWRAMVSQHRRTSSPNAGWTMATAAGALGVVLEKTDCYRLEGGKELPGPSDLRRAATLALGGAAFCVLISGGLTLVRSWIL